VKQASTIAESLSRAEDSLHSLRRHIAEILFYAQAAVADGDGIDMSCVVENLLSSGGASLMGMNQLEDAIWDAKQAARNGSTS
jgi:hypothetical protein